MGPIKKILLTGASGYLGRNLAMFFAKEGYELVLLVRPASNLKYFTDDNSNIKIYKIGTIQFDEIFKQNKIDVIIHTAANYGRKGESLMNVIDANLRFPIDLLEVAIQNNVKFFINTDTALPKELNSYSRSKKQFLEWLTASSANISVVNLQLEYFYGPNDDHTKFITFVLNELKSGKGFIDFTDATPFRDFIYIDDVVNAYAIVLKNIYNFKGLTTIEVGSGEALMLKDIIIEIQRISNYMDVKLNFGALPMRLNEIMRSNADTRQLKSLGWELTNSFQQGISKTIELENN
jgi:CDP-paratose synthetase